MLSKNQRTTECKASSFEKPGAVISHAGICVGRPSGNWLLYLDIDFISANMKALKS